MICAKSKTFCPCTPSIFPVHSYFRLLHCSHCVTVHRHGGKAHNKVWQNYALSSLCSSSRIQEKISFSSFNLSLSTSFLDFSFSVLLLKMNLPQGFLITLSSHCWYFYQEFYSCLWLHLPALCSWLPDPILNFLANIPQTSCRYPKFCMFRISP